MNDKVFEALNDLFDLVTCQGSFEKGQKCYDIIEEALTTKSKKEQAFDIVKDCFYVEEYKKGHYHLINECSYESLGDISKEEYDLLKEVLK